MKQIFTYPDNITSAFIDPNYVGDSNSGFTRRIDDLRTGNYIPWLGLDPVADLNRSTIQLMANISKFNNYYYSKRSGDNISMFDFWNIPLVKANKKLIGSEVVSLGDVTSVPANALITFTNTHEFSDGSLLRLGNFNNTLGLINDNDYYCDVVDTDTIRLRAGSPTGPFVRFYQVEDANVTSSDTLGEITFTASYGHTLTTGTLVEVTNLNNDLDIFNGNSYYVQNPTATTFQLSTDVAGVNIIGLQQTQYDVSIEKFVLKSNNKLVIALDPDLNQQTQGIRFTVDNGGYVGGGDYNDNIYDLNNQLWLKFSSLPTLHLNPIGNDLYNVFKNYNPATPFNWQNDLSSVLNGFRRKFATGVNLDGSHYTLDITIDDYGFTTSATPDKIVNIVNGDQQSLYLLPQSSYFDLVRTNADTYQIQLNSQPYYLDNQILNAAFITRTQTSDIPETIVPTSNLTDSNGVDIDETSLVLEDTTLTNLTALDASLSANVFVANSDPNLGGTGSAISATRRTGLYNSKPIIDLNNGTFAVNEHVIADQGQLYRNNSSGYDVNLENTLFDNQEWRSWVYDRYISDPNSVLFTPITIYNNPNDGNDETMFAVINNITIEGLEVTDTKMKFHTANQMEP